MTTVETRDDLDQTPPPEDTVEAEAPTPAAETNGHKPRSPRRAAAQRAPQEPPEDEGPVDVLDRAESIVRELNAEESNLLARLDRIREMRRGLGYVDSTLEETPPRPFPARRGRPVRDPIAASVVGVTNRRRKASGKRHRRSAEEIAKSVTAVVALVKRHKNGLRAEDIRAQVGLEAKEMPMVLKTAVAGRLLKSRGEKRATTYFAV